MKKRSPPVKTVYYTDPKNDEFSAPKIQAKTIGEDYVYLPPKGKWRLGRLVFYRLIAVPFAYLFCKLHLHSAFRNRELLKQVKGRGFFVYANHTQQIADAFLPNVILFPRSVYMIVHPDNVSMPVLGRINPYLGAIPLPSDLKAMRNFQAAIHQRIAEGGGIMVYPEAHIWPYYTGIRAFPATSMKYAAECGAPCFALTTTYRRRKFGARPRTVTYLDGPFYPDPSLPRRQQAQQLHDAIYDAMCRRSRLSDCEYIRYVQKEAQRD